MSRITFATAILTVFLCLTSYAQDPEILLRSQFQKTNFSDNPSTLADIWGYTDPQGNRYALVTTSSGLNIFNISDPDNPTEVGAFAGPGQTLWRDVKTVTVNSDGQQSAYALVTTDNVPNAGLLIVDLSELPLRASSLGISDIIGEAHNIFVRHDSDDPIAYILVTENDANPGITALDMSDPQNPMILSYWNEHPAHDFYMGDKWADPDWDGKDVGIVWSEEFNINVIDYTDKTNPRTISSFVYPNLTYAHSGWMDKTGRYLYSFDEIDELANDINTTVRVFDMINLESPGFINQWVGPNPSIDHNGFVKGDYIYLSNYSDGFTLLDIHDPVNPVLAGNYDTQPGVSGRSFAGAWGVYPYFNEGLVIISDQTEGLFVLQVNVPFNISADYTSLALCPGGASRTVTVSMDSETPAATILQVTNLPAGLTASQNLALSDTQDASIEFQASPELAAGVYTVTVTGENTTLDITIEVSEPDGANGPHQRYIALNAAELVDEATLVIINPADSSYTGAIEAISETGLCVVRELHNLDPGSMVHLEVSGLLRGPVNHNWLRISGDQPVVAYLEAVGNEQGFAVPAAEMLYERLTIPHIAADTASFFTVGNIINGSHSALQGLQLDTPNGESFAVNALGAGSGDYFNFADRFGGTVGPERASATVTGDGSPALAGTEIFGALAVNQVAGLKLTGDTTDTLIFSHIALVESGWWTGFAVVNPSDQTAQLTVTAYGSDGQVLSQGNRTLEPQEKILDFVNDTNRATSLVPSGVPADAVWLKIESDQPITGFELFSDSALRLFAGLQAGHRTSNDFIMPFAGNSERYAGIAVVNPSDQPQDATFALYDAAGNQLATSTVNLAANARYITPGSVLFPNRPEQAYIRVTSQGLTGFVIYGPFDSTWLAGLGGIDVNP